MKRERVAQTHHDPCATNPGQCPTVPRNTKQAKAAMNPMIGLSSRTIVLLLSFVMLVGCASTKKAGSNGDAGDMLYVANQGEATVSVVDMMTNEVIDKIDLQELGFSANAKPHHIAVEPDGSFWYLSLIGENKVLRFNAKNELIMAADFEVPGMLALNPANDELFVARSMSAVNPPKRIGVIKRGTMEIDEVDVFFPRPHALAIEPEGKYAFTASLAENSIMSVNTTTLETALTSLDGNTQTFVQFAISPDSKTMVTGGQVSGKVLIFDISNPQKPEVTHTLDVNEQPWHPVITPDGKYAYLGNKMANTVTVVDLEAGEIETVIEDSRINRPHGSAVSSDGRFVYLSNQHMDMGDMAGMHHNGTVIVLDTASNKVVKEISVGAMPSGIGTKTRK